LDLNLKYVVVKNSDIDEYKKKRKTKNNMYFSSTKETLGYIDDINLNNFSSPPIRPNSKASVLIKPNQPKNRNRLSIEK
jgi:hypothetical protein